jgi:hypothetical protein
MSKISLQLKRIAPVWWLPILIVLSSAGQVRANRYRADGLGTTHGPPTACLRNATGFNQGKLLCQRE